MAAPGQKQREDNELQADEPRPEPNPAGTASVGILRYPGFNLEEDATRRNDADRRAAIAEASRIYVGITY